MELIRINSEPNYWASDLLELRLYSAVAVGKILSVEGQKDQTTQVALCLVQFFCLTGCCQLQGKDPILGTCSNVMVLLTIFLHIDGVHITTNRNWLSECVSLCFLIMRSDIV